ncbi:hypothetical protein [Gloeocapsopsis crepidinum]|uniref:hypothetical protein n=1 Tax=Gloeocapsopsis crepidinum TaxID=693223 RepID=UPI002AD4313C|nr:hypothetical protein [Gloeocapsopsis crepidinum]
MHQPFEVYQLVNGEYQLQTEEPFWIPEIGLGIGRGQYVSGNVQREILYWYNAQGIRYQTPEEIATAERQQAERLAARLRELGESID